MKKLEELILELSPELRSQVEQFVRKLLDSGTRKSTGKPTFSWAGALRELKGGITSVELQHEISRRRLGGT